MTTREFLTVVKENANLSDEIRTYAAESIEKMDARNATRVAKVAEKHATENAPLFEQVLTALAGGPLCAADIGKATGLSTSKASALCRKLVENGTVASADEKVKGGRTHKVYSLAE